MKTITKIIWILLFSFGMASCQEMRVVKVTIVEEDGKTPVESADVTVEFLGYTGKQDVDIKGKSDANGVFSARGTAPIGMQVTVNKSGYYRSFMPLNKTKDHDVTLVLRERKNPIPLYAKRVVVKMPGLGKEYGFDFKVGDWVAPHGTGKETMCQFRMDVRVLSEQEHSQVLEICFPNQLDGIQGRTEDKASEFSDFKWHYSAPEEGYVATASVVRKRRPTSGAVYQGGRSKVLRMNTKIDGTGTLVSANYARIANEISLFGVLSAEPGFKMQYYYNPTPNDRNLEFDPSRNLFTDLKSEETVREP